jgi:uncharacterized protein (DUF779 family)
MFDKDEIIEMARQAANQCGHTIKATPEIVETLEAFAKLVAEKEREHYDDLFEQIKGWCEAYPISVFPEPDFGKAHEVLKANGMTLDAISASNMKHVITQVQKMIDAAIRARGEA